MLSLVEIGPTILEKKIFKCVLSIFAFLLLFPLKMGVAFQLNKHKSLSLKDNLCQIWLKLALWFWKRWKCEKFTDTRTGSGEEDSFQIIFTIYQLSSLLVLRLNKPRMSFTQRYMYFVPSSVEIDLMVLEKEMKKTKVYRQADTRTDDRRSEKLVSF